MVFKGKINSINRTLDGNLTVTVESPEMSLKEIAELSKSESVSVKIEKYRGKRSLDANAYYWLLIGKIAQFTGDSKPKLHNLMLDRYGVLDKMEDGTLIPFCIRDDVDYLQFSYPHLMPTQKTLSKGGKIYRWYYQIKGSSEYNTEEMSHLIDGIVSECKEMGIETLSPDEIERMMELYEKHHKTAPVRQKDGA